MSAERDIHVELAEASNLLRQSGDHDLRLACIDASNNLRTQEASIERLRRILHRYGDRVPMATSARPDWQQEIDDALGWVADNPEQPMADLEREAYEPLGRESELRPGFYEDDMP